ncbi:hypothetical protein AVI56_16925 (plasmid) [Piscirickettsia salmonis]|nr:hypothetical protein AVI56_16925 [Piscirickettsia salmonis]
MTKVKIGEILFISENTVKTHISQTLDAMNVKKYDELLENLISSNSLNLFLSLGARLIQSSIY